MQPDQGPQRDLISMPSITIGDADGPCAAGVRGKYYPLLIALLHNRKLPGRVGPFSIIYRNFPEQRGARQIDRYHKCGGGIEGRRHEYHHRSAPGIRDAER